MKIVQQLRRRLGGALGVLRGRALALDYKAASSMGRRLQSWQPSGSGPNASLFGSLDLLRRRSRSLARENAYASAALERFVSSTVGTGIVPISQHPDPETRQRIQAAFLAWTDECDADGVCDFYGLQSLVCLSERRDGEVFTRFRPRRPQDGLGVPLQLQVIESDFVPLADESGDETVRGGIVFDAIGRRRAYRMYRSHPGERFALDGAAVMTVPASEVLHTYRVKRPGQLRGEPWLTPAIVTLYELDQYVEAALLRAKLANLLAFFIKRLNDEDNPTLNEEDQGDGTGLADVAPGSVNYLDLNEDVVVHQPVAPGTDFKQFLRSMLRSVAASLGGLTYEQLAGDLEGVNYSSIRAGLLDVRRWCEAYQHQVLVFQWCRPIWDRWMETAVLAGLFSARDYREHPEWFTAVWHPHRWPWVDPQKDLEEAVGKIRAGLSTRSAECAKLGEDSRQVDAEQADDNQRGDGLGLRYESDGRNPRSGSTSAAARGLENEPPSKGIDE